MKLNDDMYVSPLMFIAIMSWVCDPEIQALMREEYGMNITPEEIQKRMDEAAAIYQNRLKIVYEKLKQGCVCEAFSDMRE